MISLCKKTTKLQWNFINKKYDDTRVINDSIDNYILPARSKQIECPFRKIKPFLSGAKNIFESVTGFHELLKDPDIDPDKVYGNHKKVTTCPGMNGVLNNSFVVISPTDLVVSIDSQRNIMYSTPDGLAQTPETVRENRIQITQHPIEQTNFECGGNFLDGKIAVKMKFPLYVNSSSDFYLQNAFWHNPSCFNVVPGSIKSNFTTTLSVFLYFDLPKGDDLLHLKIKKNEPICYMTFFDKPKLAYNKNLEPKYRSSFLRGMIT